MLAYPACELYLGSAGSRLVSEAGDLPLGISRLRSFRLGTSRGNFVWERSLGNFGSGICLWELSLWTFRSGTFTWTRFRLETCDWEFFPQLGLSIKGSYFHGLLWEPFVSNDGRFSVKLVRP